MPVPERFEYGYVLHFKEGEPEAVKLGEGTEEEVKRALEVLLAVSYSGKREVDRCETIVLPIGVVAEELARQKGGGV